VPSQFRPGQEERKEFERRGEGKKRGEGTNMRGAVPDEAEGKRAEDSTMLKCSRPLD